MKQFLTFFVLLFGYMLCGAQTTRVQVGDLYYNLSGATASVTTSDVVPAGRWDDGRGPSKYTKETYIIPSYITYEGLEYEVVAIDDWAFSGFRQDAYGYATVSKATGSTAREIILPPTIKRIGESAFANCTNLIKMIIPENVESIYSGYHEYDNSFYNTPLLRELVYLSESAPSGWYATSRTLVPNLNKYDKPSASIKDAVILPIISIDKASFIYSGASPVLTLSNNLHDHNLEYKVPSVKEKNVGTYDMTIDAKISNEYVSYNSFISVNYEIKPAEIVVSVADVSRVYGNPNPDFVINYDGLVNNETQEVFETLAVATTSAKQTSNVGQYPINLKGAKAHNYVFNYTNGELTITKADLKLSVNDATKTYGDHNPNFTLSYYGLKNNEETPAWNEFPSISTTAEQHSDVGTYTISANGGDAQNYTITEYNSGVLTIEKANQTLIWNQSLNALVNSRVTLNAISSTGLTVSYEISQNDIARLFNNEGEWYLDCFGDGIAYIRAIQNGDKNHNAATITRALVVIDAGFSPQISLHVENAGTLSSLVSENKKYQIKNLRLTGYLDGHDIRLLREMAGSDFEGHLTPGVLETLDISDCNIIPGGAYYDNGWAITSFATIGSYMFYNCKALVNLFLPNNTKTIEPYAFRNCERLSVIAIPDNVSSIGHQAFENCISTRVIPLPNQLTYIGDMAFMGCNGLSELTLPAGVSHLGDGIVKDCQNIELINVASGNTNFASKDGVLYTSTFDKLLVFPVKYANADYMVSESTTKIEPFAFVNAKNLKNLTLPEAMTSIGKDAFIGCVNLATLKVHAITPPICENECFDNISKTQCELQVPQDCYSNYWIAPVWSDFNKIIETDLAGIGEVEFEQQQVSIDGRNIKITGVGKNHNIRIFQTDGTLLYQYISEGNDVRYRPSASGIYIIAIDNQTYKIAIR